METPSVLRSINAISMLTQAITAGAFLGCASPVLPHSKGMLLDSGPVTEKH